MGLGIMTEQGHINMGTRNRAYNNFLDYYFRYSPDLRSVDALLIAARHWAELVECGTGNTHLIRALAGPHSYAILRAMEVGGDYSDKTLTWKGRL